MPRKIESIDYGSRFLKKLSRLADRIADEVEEKEMLFKADAFDSRLHTHKLHGKDKGSWAFWINNKYRIKFIFLDAHRVLFLDVGTHDIYS